MPQKKRMENEGDKHFSLDSAKEKISNMKDRANDLVQENPWKTAAVSAAIGASIGVLITILLSRRREENFWNRLKNVF